MLRQLFILVLICFTWLSYGQDLRLGIPYGHYGKISKLSFSQNNEYLLSSSNEGRVNVWRVEDSLLIYSYNGVGNLEGTDYSQRTKSQLSHSGKYLILADVDSNVLVVEINTGRTMCTVDHIAGIQDFAISDDEQLLLCHSNHTSIYELPSGKILREFSGMVKAKSTNAGFLGASDTVYSVSGGRTTFWSISTGEQVGKIKDVPREISPDGQYLFTNSFYGGRLSCWDIRTLKKKYTRFLGWRYLNTIHCSNQGDLIAVDFGARMHVMDMASGKRKDKKKRWTSYNSVLSPKATYTADHIRTYSTSSNELRIRGVLGNERIRTEHIGDASWNVRLDKMQFSNDENKLAVALSDGSVLIYNVLNSSPPILLKGELLPVNYADFGDNTNNGLISFRNGTIRICDLVNSKRWKTIASNAQKSAFWLNKELLLYSTIDSVHLYSQLSSSVVLQFKGEYIGKSKDGSMLIIRTAPKLYEVIDVNTGKTVRGIKLNKSIDHGLIGADNNTMVLAYSTWKGRAFAYNLETGQKLSSFKNPIKLYKGVKLLDINADGTHVLVDLSSTSYWNSASIMEVRIQDGKVSDRFESLSHVYNQAQYVKGRNQIVLNGNSMSLLKLIRKPETEPGFQIELIGTRSSPNITCLKVQPTVLLNVSNGSAVDLQLREDNQLLKVLFMTGGNWVQIHPSGFFDASPGAMEKMYWLQGNEVIDFDQLKHRYWIPGLAEKIMSGEALPDVKSIGSIKLEPKVELGQVLDGQVPIKITKRAGGYGRVSLSINGKEVAENILPKDLDTSLKEQVIFYDVRGHRYLTADSNFNNTISVKAYSKDEFVQGKGVEVEYMLEDENVVEPHFYGIVLGVSDYVNSNINLKYTSTDAKAISTAIGLGAEKLFENRTHMYTLHSEGDVRPTKAAIKSIFDSIALQATADDVVFIYLSGHGVNYGGTYGDFYFLTADAISARSQDYRDDYVRSTQAISTAEITEWLKSISALKQVMIIDACGSGKAVENLIASRSVESSQIKAIDRMKERTGMFIISGCAADAVSYEASKYGQGLLTYALLQAMKGAALRKNKFVDVNTIFSYARERVPELAHDIHGIQEPQLLMPSQGSFDIGILTADLQNLIPLNQPKPVFVRSMFLEASSLEDQLLLSQLLDESLDQVSERGEMSILYMDVAAMDQGNRLSGIYRIEGKSIILDYNIRMQDQRHKGQITAQSVDELVEMLRQKIEELL